MQPMSLMGNQMMMPTKEMRRRIGCGGELEGHALRSRGERQCSHDSLTCTHQADDVEKALEALSNAAHRISR